MANTSVASLLRKFSSGTSTVAPSTKKSVDEVAKEVLAGAWGNGDARKNALTAAGYNYSEVQAAVNRLAGGKTTTPHKVHYRSSKKGACR